MSYELTCPSCHARLMLKEDTGDPWLLCPRCLNMVPRPDAGQMPSAGRPVQSVPSVEADVRHSIWPAYFVVLGLTLLTTLGVIIGGTRSIDPIQDWAGFALVALVIVLTVLVLFPIGRGLAKGLVPPRNAPAGSRPLRTLLVIGLLIIIAPFALATVFFAVCTAAAMAILTK
jgi:hypothetical protein